jgi:transposase
MARRVRRNHGAAFKASVALEAVRGEKTLSELAQQFDLHPKQNKQRKDHLLDSAEDVFGGSGKGPREAETPPIVVETLLAKIGELTLENDFLSGALVNAGMVSAKR